MSTTLRKQRELEERETRILAVSRPMLMEQGYHGLSMDRIAESLQYSKGTIYNHFACKEEIILALAVETLEQRSDLFQRAAASPGRPRERLLAITIAAELFARLFPDHIKVETILRSESIWSKTSADRRLTMRCGEQRCMGIVAGVVRDGVAHGDLQLPAKVTAEDLVFGLWSMNYGAQAIIASCESLAELGVNDPFVAIRDNVARILDGYGFRPLSSEQDYDQLRADVIAKVFPDEFACLEA